MGDPRYQAGLRGIPVDEVPAKIRAACRAAQAELPPKTGIVLLAFDFGVAGGLAYISNADRDDVLAVMKEWIAREEASRG